MCNDGCSAGFPACAVIAAGGILYPSESTPHVERVIAAIRDRGYIPALAINPATPLVAGSSSVFDPSLTVDKSVRVLRSAMAQEPKKA